MTATTEWFVDPADMVWVDNTVHVADRLFPAISYVPGELNLTRSMVYVVNAPDTGWLYVFVWSGVDDLQLGQSVSEVQEFKRDRVLLLGNEQTLTYRPDGGCGCGHPMKTWNPWHDAVIVGTPRPRVG